AIADGKTTIAEKQAVDTNYSSYKTALASLQTAIENANKAIQNKLDALSTDRVNNLQIGGTNLISNLPENWEQGALGETNGIFINSIYRIRTKNSIPLNAN